MKNRKEIMEEIGDLLERAEYGALVFVEAFLREADAAGAHSPPPAAPEVSLRLGQGAALTCHRQVIHSRAPASQPLPEGASPAGDGGALISQLR